MLLDNESCRARSESVLITAQIRSSASFAYSRSDFAGSGRAAAHDPNPAQVTFASGHCDHTVGRNTYSADDSVINDSLDVSNCQWMRTFWRIGVHGDRMRVVRCRES